jgi:hypothetical protein
LKTVWFEGARQGDQREERKVQILSAAKAFEILTGMLETKIRDKETERNREKNWELPQYSEMQADTSGYIRALREVQSLIDIGGQS